MHCGLDFEHPFNFGGRGVLVGFSFRPIANKIRSIAVKVEQRMFQIICTTINEPSVDYRAFPFYCLYIENASKQIV